MKNPFFFTIIVLMFCVNSFSQERNLNIPIVTDLKDSNYTNLEKSIGLSIDINYQIQKNMDKKITKKQLDEKAIPLQKSLDSLTEILNDDDKEILKHYQIQLANILVDKQIAINKKKRSTTTKKTNKKK